MRRSALAAFIAGCVLLAACGGSANPELPTVADAVKGDQVAPESFLEALRGSFRPGFTAVVAFDVRGTSSLRGGGAVRYTARRMDADLRIADWQVKGASIDIRTVGGTTYMRVPESRGLWVNLSEGGSGLPGADLGSDADPRKDIGRLRRTIRDVRFTGTEPIAGVRTRRFQVVTEPAATTSSATAGGTARPTVTEYWFDVHGRVVRRESDLADSGSATFTWTRWGRPVTIRRPASSQVITLKRLEQLRRQQSAQPSH